MTALDKLTSPIPIQKRVSLKRAAPAPSTLDRFVPLRRTNDIPHSLLTAQSTGKKLSPRETTLKAVLNPEGNSRILLFSPPKRSKLEIYDSPSSPRSSLFRLPQKSPRPYQHKLIATKILNAPDYLNDFYSNTLACTANYLLLALTHTDNNGDVNGSALYSTIYASNIMCSSVSGHKITESKIIARGTFVNSVLPANKTSVLSGWSNGMLRLHDIESGTYFQEIGTGTTAKLYSLSQIGATTFACGSALGALNIIDIRQAQSSVHFQGNAHTQSIPGIAFNNCYHLATGGNDDTVKLWDIRNPSAPLLSHNAHTAAVKALAFYQSNYLISGGGTADKTLCLLNTTSGNISDQYDTGTQITGIQCLQNPNYFVSSHGYPEGGLKLWHIKDYKKLRLVCQSNTDSSSRILSLKASPAEDTLAALKTDETLRFFKVSGQQTQKPLACSNKGTMLTSIPFDIR